ncbi:MAG: epoxyqueuosine reductase QueH [Treponema sp.]|jgi:predicted adenine nucleotide alpha hydrolase (AANH) superfamily ATPase|nr:epoxyqueuosine reductase QueH [Treponema sp.]
MKILVHACCAPCSTAFLTGLKNETKNDETIIPHLFWYNPNIHPFTEYQSRRDSLAAFAQDEKIELIVEDEYGLRKFLSTLSGSYDEGRCLLCYRMRLEKTAYLALEKGYNAFSTTLLVSLYQKHDLIQQVGEECANQFGIQFFYRDFRPWFREGQKKAREKGRYMQKYCGCIFSEEERYK